MHKMRKYSEYKYSGVKWIGDIPKHWGIVELKRLTKFNPQRREELDKETLVGYAPMDKVRSDMLTPLSIQIKNLTTGLTYFEEGDVVMAKVTPCFENGNVAIVPKMVHYCGYGSSELFVYRCNEEKLEPRILLYYLLSAGFVNAGVSSMTGTGGLKRVSPTFARNVRIPLAPLAEQRAIVSYLDGKVGQIDTYVAKQTQQIELLKELKQAVIANAVTKGIDTNPNAKRKQSGVNWLGEIPEHWEVSKLRKHFIPRIQKVSDKDFAPLSVTKDGILPQLDTACKTDNGENRKLVRKGDYVVNSRSDRKGSGGISPFDGSVSLINIVIYPIDGEQEYYHYLFRCNNFVEEFYRNGRGIVADLWTTRYQEMKNIEIPIPPLSEQRAIVSYIEAKTASINKLIDAYEQQVERVKEYKQRLISDAVTGKMNVTDEHTQTN
jgi:restriction modification system DNA specificity subunit